MATTVSIETNATIHFEFNQYGYRILAAGIMCLVTIIGVIGNSLVVVALFLSNKLQTTTNVFVACLALTDLLNCIFYPVQVISLLDSNGPPQIGSLCGIAGGIIITTNIASIVLLTLIAINRWIKITRSHETYARVYSPRNLVLMVSISWIYPILVMILPQMAGLGQLGYSQRYKICGWSDEQRGNFFMSMMLALSIISAFVVITSCYVVIALHVHKQARQIAAARSNPTSVSRQPAQDEGPAIAPTNVSVCLRIVEQQIRANPWNAREMKVTKNLATVVCVFFIFVLPYGVCSVIPGSYIPFICFTILILSNSSINPVIYGFKHPVFSQVFLCIFQCRLDNVAEPSRGLRYLLRHR